MHRGVVRNKTGPGARAQALYCTWNQKLSPNQRLLFATRLFFTSKTFGTPFARKPARFLSASLSTTPSRLTCPFSTMMRNDGIEHHPYLYSTESLHRAHYSPRRTC